MTTGWFIALWLAVGIGLPVLASFIGHFIHFGMGDDE